MIHRDRKGDRFIMFNDGIANVYQVTDRRVKSLKVSNVHFTESSVGERRHWDAYVAGILITRAVKVQKNIDVEFGDLLVIDGNQYIVAQKDLKTDMMPDCWLLSLQMSPIEYKVDTDDSN